ncbi:hypothetical protein [Chitinilyticum piscinae]|uniref:Uncharacterized protein n=1 Tax=Chitinilyticum piscinae TaxID=2866724 RepID=A0A8J7K8C6_9NEIS|nr:hypothetical protein [Chitinilyticum piscinae]MBE9609313.1 hypothetical protein [Chitinilyticum piscinae]
MRGAFFPVVLIVLGAGWLLNELNIMPEVSWLVIIGLAVAGMAILLVDGVNKSSIVNAPLLLGASLATFLCQYQGLSLRLVLPALLMLLGVLLLIRRHPAIPPGHYRKLHRRRSEPELDA